MRIIYMGTPDFAVAPLKAIYDSGHEIVAVVTQPDKKAERGNKITVSAVKTLALSLGLKVLQYDKIRRRENVEELKSLNAELIVTCAFGQILSQKIIDLAPYGIYNIHASMLPKYRGAAPIQWAVIDGEKQTGVTVMKTDIGIDTGDIILDKRIDISGEDTSLSMFNKLSALGAEAILEAIRLTESGSVVFKKQDETLATHTRMLNKEDGIIDFSLSYDKIDCLVRGMNPWPSAYTYYNNSMLKFWAVEPCNLCGKCGEVLVADDKEGLVVACGGGSLRVTEIQGENAKRMKTTDYLRGKKIAVGSILGAKENVD